MYINRVENCCAFKQLQIRSSAPHYFNSAKLEECKKQLSKTKFIDVILDSQGLAIKEKMTDILHRIQSFSLLPQENAVQIRMKDEKNSKFKYIYNTLEDARSDWELLTENSKKNCLEEYTNLALWLDAKY